MKLKPIQIRIKNYQSIEDVSLEVKGLTVISGKTNIGKSAIIRAISGAILNDSVIGMVRKGSAFSSVEVKSEEYEFKWEKGERGINRYTIGDRILDKVGAKTLDEMSQIGFKSVRVGSDEVYPWLATQFFPIFLLDKPGSQVTEFISEVSRLNVLQNAINLSNKKKKRLNDQHSLKEAEIKRISLKKKSFSVLPEVIRLHAEIDDQISSIIEYDGLIDNLAKIWTRLESNKDRIFKIQKITQVKLPSISDRVELDAYKRAEAVLKTVETLNNSISRVDQVQEVRIPGTIEEFNEYGRITTYSWIQKESQSVKLLQGIHDLNIPEDLKQTVKDINLMQQQYVKIHRLKIKISKSSINALPGEISEIFDYIKAVKLQERINVAFRECKRLKSEHDKAIEDEKEINSVIDEIPLCPTCARPHAENH
jgi:ABC-type cobalamin/Fe3+-siderophores transport system ATPase subunit